MKTLLSAWLFILIVTLSSNACATPTPTVTTLSWDAYKNPAVKGFYVYWREEAATLSPASAYSNANRAQIKDALAVSVPIASILPAVHATSLCFVITAYDGEGSESGFSNEVCGFAGLVPPSNGRLQ